MNKIITGSLQKKMGKYYAVINLRDSDGKRKQKWLSTGFTIKGNKKNAEKRLREILNQFEKNHKIITNKKMLFSTFIEIWLSKKQKEIQTTTYDGYEHIISKHIIPHFESID